MFNTKAYIEHLGMGYRTGGKNVGHGWIGLEECFACGDRRFHFGVNLKTGSYNCWVCGVHGNVVRLIQNLEHISYEEAKDRMLQFRVRDYIKEEKDVKSVIPIQLPMTTKHLSPYPHVMKFLYGRGFDMEDWNMWDAGYCYTGKYKYYIIFPIREHNKIVNFVARATLPTDKRYLNASNNIALESLHNCIFTSMSLTSNNEIFIVEGIFDALKVTKLLSKTAIAILGKSISNQQIIKIKHLSPTRVYVLLDKDAWAECMELSYKLRSIINCPVDSIFLSLKDPSDYQTKTQLMKEVEAWRS